MEDLEKINHLKQAIRNLSESDAKSMLFQLLLDSKVSEEKILDMQQSIIKMVEDTKGTNNAQTVHIVFGDSPGGSLKIAFRDTDYEETEAIIVLSDIWSIGPVKDLHSAKGIGARVKWFQERYFLQDEDFEQYQQLMLEAIEKVKSIPSHQDIVIWTCQNAHEQTGVRLVLAMLKDRPNTVSILDTFTAFHESYTYPQHEGEHFPRTSGEANAEQLLHFYVQSKWRPLQKEERQALCEEGLQMLADEDKVIRTWVHQRLLHNTDESRDDDFIIESANRLYQEVGKVEYWKAARLIGEVLGHMEQYTGDDWIEYRLRHLIEQGVFSYKGNLKAMRYYEVKLNDEYLKNH